MKGKYKLNIKNAKVYYEFELNRKVTVIKGESASGKTTLISMISRYNQNPNSTPIKFDIKPKCKTIVLNNVLWRQSKDYDNCIIFIDEHFEYLNDREFNKFVNKSNNYFVIVDRDDTGRLDYSVNDIYEMKVDDKYSNTHRLYTNYLEMGDSKYISSVSIDKIVVEDSNAGCTFYKAAYPNNNVDSSESNSKILSYVKDHIDENLFIVADGVAFGKYINELSILMDKKSNISLFLPESFEYFLLCGGILDIINKPNCKIYDGANVDAILVCPEDYIDITKFATWERFFTNVLSICTSQTEFPYNKTDLNDFYISSNVLSTMKKFIPIRDDTVKGMHFV